MRMRARACAHAHVRARKGCVGEAVAPRRGSGSGPGRVTRCLGPRVGSVKKNTRHNNLVRSLVERAHVQS